MTIDADPPSSSVLTIAATATNVAFQVCWSGTDVGTGVAGFDVYFSTNFSTTNGPWTLWLANTTYPCAMFYGQNATTYSFYSVARDFTGQTELAPLSADVTTTTLTNDPPLILPANGTYIHVGQLLLFTNSAYDPDLPIVFSLGDEAPAGAEIGAESGIFAWQPVCLQGNTTNAITVWATDSGTPPKASSMTFTVIVSECVSPVLDTLVLEAGKTGTLPFNLTATTNLAQLSMRLPLLASQFERPSLDIANVAMICTNWVWTLESSASVADTNSWVPHYHLLHATTNLWQLIEPEGFSGGQRFFRVVRVKP